MKKVLFFIAALFIQLGSTPIYSQSATEICDNGIDDDGDGLIDINDPDCVCHIESIIFNNSFETYTECPNAYGQLGRSLFWEQGNGASSDYLNSCGFLLEDFNSTGLYPFPHGNAVVGGAFINDYKEYIATCLTQPLQPNVSYTLKFHLSCFQLKNTNYAPTGKVCDALMDFEPVEVTLYGNANCSMGFGMNGPSDNGWQVLGTLTYTPAMEWAEVSITFTPQIAVAAVALGAPLGILPQSYPTFSTIAPATQCSPYFLYDNLILNETSLFEQDNGLICYNSQLLTANPSFTVTNAVTYQWYYQGAAIAGATSVQYTMPEGNNLDDYSIKIIDGDTCVILHPFNEITPIPQLSQSGCNISLIAEAGLAPYQWYLDGIAIEGATAQGYTPLASGNYTVTATKSCGLTRMSAPVAITVCSDMAVTKEITDVVNGLINFEITAKNLGPQNNTDVIVTDVLPTGYTYVGYTATTGSYDNVTGIWSIGSLAVEEEASLFISAQVNTTGEHTNTATITGRNTDIDVTNNTASATPLGKLYLSKIAQNEEYHAEGEIIVYNLEVTNTGNVTLHNITVSDANADPGSISPSQIVSLAPGETAFLTAQHTITAADVAAGKVINQANAIGESFNGLFVKTNSDNPGTATAEDATITYIYPLTNLAVTKTDGQDTYIAGNVVTYTITVTNNGPSIANEVLIEDILPEGITVMQWTGSNQTMGTGSLQQTIPVLAVGESITYTVDLTVPEDFEGDLVNTVTVMSVDEDPDVDNNSATDTDTQEIPEEPEEPENQEPEVPCTDCKIPKGISPNGDTKNDVLDLSYFTPVDKLEIFNRYGKKVYSRNNYTNQWGGQSDDGNELPTGTYYYVVYFETEAARSGWIY
jgi:gliding motility-associated-like protein/uncharacterized repeat protein (TIGR01451 family)